jgi:hypothetical protein
MWSQGNRVVIRTWRSRGTFCRKWSCDHSCDRSRARPTSLHQSVYIESSPLSYSIGNLMILILTFGTCLTIQQSSPKCIYRELPPQLFCREFNHSNTHFWNTCDYSTCVTIQHFSLKVSQGNLNVVQGSPDVTDEFIGKWFMWEII